MAICIFAPKINPQTALLKIVEYLKFGAKNSKVNKYGLIGLKILMRSDLQFQRPVCATSWRFDVLQCGTLLRQQLSAKKWPRFKD